MKKTEIFYLDIKHPSVYQLGKKNWTNKLCWTQIYGICIHICNEPRFFISMLIQKRDPCDFNFILDIRGKNGEEYKPGTLTGVKKVYIDI